MLNCRGQAWNHGHKRHTGYYRGWESGLCAGLQAQGLHDFSGAISLSMTSTHHSPARPGSRACMTRTPPE